ncbi:MAG: hypothetical protein JST43_00990 [Bacteroidetes bacterium]|nr:hypothetical protein [Bacteroidota bacterium]MBS1540666.1 hypothetical protein [Bacteroidota bacterium]
MKYSLFFIVCLLLVAACSQGVKKDLTTGLTTSYNGFAIEEVLLVDSADQNLKTMQVPLASRFSVVLQGITNYQLKDDKAFPGLSMSVTDSKGNAIINEADLFASSEGYSAKDASVLRATVTVGSPMQSGQTYHCKVRVFDKQKADSEIVCEVDFTVQ